MLLLSDVDDDFLDPDYYVQVEKDNLMDGISFLSSEEDDLEPGLENIEYYVTRNIDNEINENYVNNENDFPSVVNIDYNSVPIIVKNYTENINTHQNENNDDPLNEDLQPSTSKERKNQSLCKRNITILQRAKDEDIISLRNHLIKKRVTGPDCKCRWQCFSKFTWEDKLSILNTFYHIGNKQKQDTFLGGLIKIKNITRRRPTNRTGKEQSFSSEFKFVLVLLYAKKLFVLCLV